MIKWIKNWTYGSVILFVFCLLWFAFIVFCNHSIYCVIPMNVQYIVHTIFMGVLCLGCYFSQVSVKFQKFLLKKLGGGYSDRMVFKDGEDNEETQEEN